MIFTNNSRKEFIQRIYAEMLARVVQDEHVPTKLAIFWKKQCEKHQERTSMHVAMDRCEWNKRGV